MNPPDDDTRALDWLMRRRSCATLLEPGPDETQLRRILQAASTVPDFHTLRPYRFLVAQGEGRQRLGAALQRAAQRVGAAAKLVERAPRMPLRAPVVIIAVSSPRPDPHVSALDQLLCAGATVLTMHHAARALGFGSLWRSGWPMELRAVHEELGLAATEQIVGYLYVGSMREPAADPRPAVVPPCAWL